MAKILSSKAFINSKKLELKLRCEKIKVHNILPTLSVVLVGQNPASLSYVKNKKKFCLEIGADCQILELEQDIDPKKFLHYINQLNLNAQIHGIIIQLPLPWQLQSLDIRGLIIPEKDVDGFHPNNFGRMALGIPAFHPATPSGIMMLLDRYKINTDGKNCVVLGRSNIVGTPISILMSKKTNPGNATVTIAHSRTSNLKEICANADIIIAALGIPNFVKSDMVKNNAVIIDVGINKIEDHDSSKKYRLVGDVDFENVKHKVSAITPVPGGVGPMTITALLDNTWKAYSKTIK